MSHYADDTLKLKAVRFLIENMPGHNDFELNSCCLIEEMSV